MDFFAFCILLVFTHFLINKIKQYEKAAFVHHKRRIKNT